MIQLEAHRSLSLVAFTVLYYDFILTIADEIDVFWFPRRTADLREQRWTAVSLCFFFHRYLAIIGHAAVILEMLAPGLSEKATTASTLCSCLGTRIGHALDEASTEQRMQEKVYSAMDSMRI
ncbi:hypothetical protein FA95DRAFT_96548 [Auriscalpium vulgare]|uniref:Uncharacterized protein n=1 Tax=Auriscalpium vulgare TaxID=40419 RepID=A0ACB8RNN1_9AGAM|nr:hypothetical protein FA95DRAFT_96548 [Auriscalpium vulgare]